MPSFFSRVFGQTQSQAWVDIDTLVQRLAGAEPPLLIDVRQPEEFAAPPGHLPGAINIPLPEIPARIAEIASQDRPIVLVCKTDRRSAKAAEILGGAGLAEIAVLRGGTDGWHERGLKLD